MQAPLLDQFTLSNKIVIYPKISLKLLFEFPYCCLLVVRYRSRFCPAINERLRVSLPASYNHNCFVFCVQFSRYNLSSLKSSLKTSVRSSISLPKKGISNADACCLPIGLQEIRYTLKIKQRSTSFLPWLTLGIYSRFFIG